MFANIDGQFANSLDVPEAHGDAGSIGGEAQHIEAGVIVLETAGAGLRSVQQGGDSTHAEIGIVLGWLAEESWKQFFHRMSRRRGPEHR